MDTRLAENCDFELLALLEYRGLVQAWSGGGKSHALRRIIEQAIPHVQVLVIDREGEFITLREKFDLVICAPTGGDAVATPDTASLLARRLLETRVSAVLNIYDLQAKDRLRFVKNFFDALVNSPKALWHDVLIILDEAHIFCPQTGDAESAGAVIDLATLGRKRGFGLILATQRLSKLHKDAAAEMGNKMIGRTGLDIDIKRAADEIGWSKAGASEQLRGLSRGEFFIFGPAFSNEVKKIKVGPVATTHPQRGKRLAATAAPSEKIKHILAQGLQDIAQQAEEEARTIEDLRKENAALRARLDGKGQRDAITPDQVAEEVNLAVQKVKQEVWAAAGKEAERAEEKRMARFREYMDQALGVLGQPITLNPVFLEGIAPEPVAPRQAAPARLVRLRDDLEQRFQARAVAKGVTGPQQAILDSLRWMEGFGINSMPRPSVAAHAGASPNSSSFANNLGTLRSAGLIEYPGTGLVALNGNGRRVANSPLKNPTESELHDAWRRMVTGPQAAILGFLIANYPRAYAREDVAGKVGASAGSSSFANNLGRLRTLGAIEYPASGQVMAARILFPGRR